MNDPHSPCPGLRDVLDVAAAEGGGADRGLVAHTHAVGEAVRARRLGNLYRVVQLNFTPEIEVFYVMFERSLPILVGYLSNFHFRCKIHLDLPVSFSNMYPGVQIYLQYGCVNPTSRLPPATSASFTQPLGHKYALHGIFNIGCGKICLHNNFTFDDSSKNSLVSHG